MSSSESDVIEIVESEAELRADERVGWRLELSGDTVGLETEDAGSNVVNIIPPTSDDRVSIYFCAWNSGFCESSLEGVPGLSVGNFSFLANSCLLSDEGVLSFAAE